MEKGLTQERLAEKTELSLTAVQKVEAGQGGIRLETLIRIAVAFGVSLDVLVNIGSEGNRHRFGQEEVCLLFQDKTAREVEFAMAVMDSIFKYKDEFLD